MKLTFSYDLDRDVENFIKSARSINNLRPTKIQELYIAEHGEEFGSIKVRSFLEKYIQDNNIDFDLSISKIEQEWRTIENDFIHRTQDIFGEYPYDVHGYFSVNSRCTYNIKEHYFFVFISSKNANAIIMHELLHFYTWQKFYNQLKREGLSDQKYNDIKESLTELLNLEYKDLMGDTMDKGYPQHKEMREMIQKMWAQNKNINQLVGELASR